MNFTESIQTCYKKFFDFSGRASKSEYWWFQLYQLIIYVLSLIFQSDLALLFSILVIANLLPLYACGVRRIHDSDKSGWFILLSLIPIIGLYVFVLLIQDGSKGKNRFGAKPKKQIIQTLNFIILYLLLFLIVKNFYKSIQKHKFV